MGFRRIWSRLREPAASEDSAGVMSVSFRFDKHGGEVLPPCFRTGESDEYEMWYCHGVRRVKYGKPKLGGAKFYLHFSQGGAAAVYSYKGTKKLGKAREFKSPSWCCGLFQISQLDISVG